MSRSEEILADLEAERDRINQAIDALSRQRGSGTARDCANGQETRQPLERNCAETDQPWDEEAVG